MSGSSQVWWVCNFMIQTQPDPLLKNFCNPTQPTKFLKPIQPNGLGWIGSDLTDFLHTPKYGYVRALQKVNTLPLWAYSSPRLQSN